MPTTVLELAAAVPLDGAALARARRARARQLAAALLQAAGSVGPDRAPRGALELAVVFLLSHRGRTRDAYARDLAGVAPSSARNPTLSVCRH